VLLETVGLEALLARLPDAFLVTIEDRDVSLPDGTRVESGLVFRNDFHLNPLAAADLFVPCGGRPDAVHINNVQRLLDDRGQPRWRFVVEGANLFFTQPARRALERAGVIFFKDAAANKGGVTSSSLEVLAALALDDDQYAACMEVHGTPPAFYLRYTEQVQQRIEAASRAEFEATWREHERSQAPRSIITDLLSAKINRLEDQIAASDLPDHPRLRARVVAEACPPVLLETVGLEALLARLPDAYVHALVGAQLASSYVYRFGLDASELQFFDFVQGYLA
jgi:glutamate dehydrogenase